MITQEELEIARPFTTSEALRKAPAVNVRDEEGIGLRPNIGIRGLNPTRSTRVLLLDDPTTGLDPIVATTVDDEIVKLRDLEQVTGIVVTHQIRDAFYVATHRAIRTGDGVRIVPVGDDEPPPAEFMVLHDGRIRFEGTGAELLKAQDDYLKDMMFMTLPPW